MISNKLKALVSQETIDTPSATNKELIDMMIKAVCDEVVDGYSYCIASNIARGDHHADVIPEYDDHCKDELDHAKDILDRLEELGIKFDLSLEKLSTSGNPRAPIVMSDIQDQLKILIKGEEDTIEFYNKIIKEAKEIEDWTTEKLFKNIQEKEWEHRKDLQRLLEEFE